MKKNRALFLSSIVLCSLWLNIKCYGQEKTYAHEHYGSENGLPSSEVYEVMQDKEGFIWFCTDAGVSRFNGYEFENFNTQDGLTDNTIFHFYEDFKGRIWFLTFNSQLCYYQEDSIYPYPYNNLIKESLSEGWIRSISIDSNETLFFAANRYGFGSITKNGECNFSKPVKSDTGEISFKTIGVGHLVYGIGTNNDSKHDFFIGPDSKTLITYSNTSISRYNIYHKSLGENQFVFNVGGKTGLYNNGEIKLLSFDKPLHQVFMDGKGRIWMAYHNNGILIYDNLEDVFNEKAPINQLFSGKNVAYIFKDKEGAIWITTQNNGVYYLPNISVDVYSIEGDELTNRISTITSDDSGNVFFGTFDSQIFSISHNLAFSFLKAIVGDKNSVSEIDFSIDAVSNEKLIHTETYLIAKNNTHWYIKGNKLWGINGLDTVISDLDYSKNLRFNTVYEDKQNQMFFGTLDGLYTYSSDQFVKVSTSLPFASTRIEDIDELNDGTLLIGTKDKGLFFWKDQSAYKAPIIGVLTSPILRDIHVDKDENIWISTPSGINRLIKDSKGNYNVQQITDVHGLPSKEVNGITSSGNIIWVATNKGVAKFNKNEVKENEARPPVYLNNVYVNEQKTALQSSYNLAYNENYLEFEFLALSYRSKGKVLYRYKMEGIDEDWVESFSRKIRYPSLNYGSYVFKVQAANEDGKWSPIKKICLEINPPYWKTWWFISVNSIIILFIVLFVLRAREVRKNKKANQKRLLEQQKLLAAKSELKALRAQMNPHFTFNTLSAIQATVNNSDPIGASKYIVDFAKLIRKVLENSKHTYIALKEESEMLDLYIKLEQLRFSHKFSYEIIIDEKLDLDFLEIPSMVIQPYVENAIIHGLAAKKENGHLTIQFICKEDKVFCMVEDNGIGREQAMKARMRSGIVHNSVAMEITKDRIDLYKKELGEDLSVKIIDLKNESNTPVGTRVEIVFPI